MQPISADNEAKFTRVLLMCAAYLAAAAVGLLTLAIHYFAM